MKAVLSDRQKNLFLLLLVLVPSFLCFAPALKGYFIDDDFKFLSAAEHLSVEEVLNPFNPHLLAYRPVSFMTFVALHTVFGLEPLGYHAFNVVLHLLNTVLVFFLALRILGSRPPAFLGALLFGICRLHGYNLFVPDSLGEPLVLFFVLLTLFGYERFLVTERKRHLLWTLPVFLAALLTKENALVLPAVLLFFTKHQKGIVKGHLPVLAIFFVLSAAFGISLWLLDKYYVFYLPEYHLGIHTPLNMLEHFASLTSLVLIQDLPVFLYAGIALAILFLLRMGSDRIRTLVAWTLLFAVPYSPFVFNFHRTLYLPSVGFYLLAAALLHAVHQRLEKRSLGFARTAALLFVILVAATNVGLCRRDMADYVARSSTLKTLAEQIPRLDPPIPPGSHVWLIDAPDVGWILEDCFRLFLKDPTLSLLALEEGEETDQVLSRLGNNAYTKNRIGNSAESVAARLIILHFDGRGMREVRRIELSE